MKLGRNWKNKTLEIFDCDIVLYVTIGLDDKICPRCGKPLVIKTNRRKGSKFYSCQPPQFGGDGCGYIENID